METKVKNISEFMFLPRGATNIVESHTIPSGDFERALYFLIKNRIDLHIEQGGFGGNSSFGLFDSKKGEMKGSTPLLQILIDQELKHYGARTALPVDLGEQRVLDAVDGKYYTDSRALVLRGTNKGYERNIPIFNELANRVGSLEEPVLVYGLKVEPWPEDEKGYGLRVVPTEEFTLIKDDRLNSKWNGFKFDELDSNGLPKHLDEDKGKRTWYTSDGPLSRLHLYRGRYLDAGGVDLSVSVENGRVVVVPALAGAPNFSAILEEINRNKLLGILSEARTYIQELEQKFGQK